MPAGGAGRLMQLGAGGEVRIPPLIEVRPLVCPPITRMSLAGMPCAFTVMPPLRETDIPVVIRWPRPDTAGAAGRGQPGWTGTTTTCLAPSWRSLVLAPAIPSALDHKDAGDGSADSEGAAAGQQRLAGRDVALGLRRRPGVRQRRSMFAHQVVEQLV